MPASRHCPQHHGEVLKINIKKSSYGSASENRNMNDRPSIRPGGKTVTVVLGVINLQTVVHIGI